VLIETEGFTEGKVGGEILDVIIDEKKWRKEGYWPEEFGLKEESSEDQDQEERKEDLKETSD